MRTGGIAAAALLAALLAAPGGAGALTATADAKKKMFMKSKSFRMSRPDEKRRRAVRCGGRRTIVPLGGGMISDPPPGPDGEGVYPHSYERLGVQRGWHVTPVLYDPSPGSTTPRRVTLQVVCGSKLKHVTPPHTTVYVNPGQTKTITATCPGRRHLFGGGFQRTDFTSRGGNYVTESRAIDSKTWVVTGSAFGGFGGELTAIAYCRRSKKPLLTEVTSPPTMIAPGELGSATTSACPGGRRLVFGGFSSFPVGSTFLTNGMINRDGSWSASGFNVFGPAATVTAHGYCHRKL